MSDWITRQQALCDAATDGPWEADGMDSGHSRYETSRWVVDAKWGDTICDMASLSRIDNEQVAKDDGAADAAFIAAARTSLPKALSALREIDDIDDLPGDVRAILATLDADS